MTSKRKRTSFGNMSASRHSDTGGANHEPMKAGRAPVRLGLTIRRDGSRKREIPCS